MKLNSSVFRTMMLSVLLFAGMAAEARVISGTVKDATGETIISASVVVKGTTIGTVTDFDGNYTLDVPDDAKVLVFSYIGMKTQELNITGNVMNVTHRHEDAGVEHHRQCDECNAFREQRGAGGSGCNRLWYD